jgi:hypothetical protein
VFHEDDVHLRENPHLPEHRRRSAGKLIIPQPGYYNRHSYTLYLSMLRGYAIFEMEWVMKPACTILWSEVYISLFLKCASHIDTLVYMCVAMCLFVVVRHA